MKEGNIKSYFIVGHQTKKQGCPGGCLWAKKKSCLSVRADSQFENSMALKDRNPTLVCKKENAKVILN